MDNYCVILAGGIGSRFWPLSTSDCPKQFLAPMGLGKSFLRLTFERFHPIDPKENFLIVTSKQYRQRVMEQLPELNDSQILSEPIRRNTVPCIAYASWRISKENPDACIIVTPADHLILQEEQFRHIITEGLDFVDRTERLLTIGVTPTRPETGHGYIHIDSAIPHKVKDFTEKPDIDKAKTYIESGEYLWNSGIFVWTSKGIKNAIRQFVPKLATAFDDISLSPTDEQMAVNNIYPELESISIDFAVLEKSKDVFTSEGNFGWSDIGTWGSLKSHTPTDTNGNAVSGRILCYDSQHSLIIVEKGKVDIVESLNWMPIINEKDRLSAYKPKDAQSIRYWS